MSNDKPRNPSAFPQSKKAGEVSFTEGGMTLRDYFAASVAEECFREARLMSVYDLGGRSIYKVASIDAYAMADAMLAERERDL